MAQVLHYRPTDPISHQYGPGYEVGRGEGAQALRCAALDAVLLGMLEEGELKLSGEGFVLQLKAGDCFVVPQGVALDWQAQGALRYWFIRIPGVEGAASHGQPLKLALDGRLQSCNPPSANVLLSPTPSAWSQAVFEQGALRIGVWACEPYQRRQVEPGYSELMHIIDGQITLTESDGTQHTIAAGETVVVPAGATNAWASEVLVRKVYCIYG
ncbi:cupin domain-containing protein [Pseudomonas sp. NPDC089743]|uniref:cupin domain-containing protein n=1 Tax=Pseudomonas sp. NPDC089743 TaxID=3364471 RepID=UPI00382F5082